MDTPHDQQSPVSDKRPLVLIVEDNSADVFLVEEAIALRNLDVRSIVLCDGEEAVRYFTAAESDPGTACPDVLLLDLNLPRRSGGEVLEFVKSGRCSGVKIIIMTSSSSPEDQREAVALGANYYFNKPVDYQAFMKIGELLERVLGGADQ